MTTKMFESAEFQMFYSAYPKKTHRDEALAAWKKLKPDPVLIALLMKDVKTRVWPADRDFIPNPATYLHKRRWLDEASGTPESNERTPKTGTGAVEMLKAAKREKEQLTPEQIRENKRMLSEIISCIPIREMK